LEWRTETVGSSPRSKCHAPPTAVVDGNEVRSPQRPPRLESEGGVEVIEVEAEGVAVRAHEDAFPLS